MENSKAAVMASGRAKDVPMVHVFLFGKFKTQYHGQSLTGLESRKVQELFCYLLLHRDRPHPRESLASLLWDGDSMIQSRTYLRKALWQLQSALPAHPLLQVNAEWVQLSSGDDFWLDLSAFEEAFNLIRKVPAEALDDGYLQVLQSAVDLYRGEVLTGWYQDWCLYERTRFQHMYLVMLDKLMDYCKAHHEYESGIEYGMRILHYDRAHERTHRKLMRLLFLSGDRTAALRQHERCLSALNEELGVSPGAPTEALYQQIKDNRLDDLDETPLTAGDVASILRDVFAELHKLQEALSDIQQRLQGKLLAVEKPFED